MQVFHQRMLSNLCSSSKRRSVVISLAIAGMVMVGCSEGKISQCNKLIEIANQAATSVESVTQSSSPDDPDAFLRIADTADEAAGQLEALEIEDETLQGFRQRFITLYVETSSATRELVTAVNEQNAPGAEEAYNRLETATNTEGPLVDEVNQYCGGAPQ